MKTLREMELEHEVWELERKLYDLTKKDRKLDCYDPIPSSIDCSTYGARELPMVARVAMEDSSVATRKSVVLHSTDKDRIQFGYYLPSETLYDRRHIEQVMVTMHENLMHQIVKGWR